MANKKQDRYFDMFIELCSYSYKASLFLREILLDFDSEKFQEYLEKMHAIEHDGDVARHKMMKALAREFITPIEREDIVSMGERIDTVTDKIEDVLQKMYMYDVKVVREDAIAMIDTIIQNIEVFNDALGEFHDFKKSKTIQEKLIEINRIEEEGDRLYIEGTRRIFTDPDITPLEAFGWSHIYHYMEDVNDACEDAADVIEGVVLRNT